MALPINTFWLPIYNQICNVLLEPGGLQLGLLTQSQFYVMAQEVLMDFYSKTDIVKKVFNFRMQVGVSTYNEPDQMGDIDTALANQTYMHRTSGYYLDNSNSTWPNLFNAPVEFREDELPVSQLQVVPSPNVGGNDIPMTNEGFGVIASTTLATDFNIVANGRGFGQWASFTGNPYISTVNAGFGVISCMTPSEGNITAVATLSPDDLSYFLLLPSPFQLYLKYGILAKIFASDSELKDEQKAYYCEARYAEGVNLAAAILGGDFVEQVQSA